MELQIGGIYTLKIGIDLIVINKDENNYFIVEIDGYLGKIPNDLLNKLLIQLDKLDWYLYCF